MTRKMVTENLEMIMDKYFVKSVGTLQVDLSFQQIYIHVHYIYY